MSYSSARTYRGGRPATSAGRGAATWLLKAVLTALLGLSGYLFVTQMAVPGIVDGIVGQSQTQN